MQQGIDNLIMNGQIHKSESDDSSSNGVLSQDEEKYFIDQVPNNVTLFKGSIFTNDQFRDEELRIEFAINSKFDGFNISK